VQNLFIAGDFIFPPVIFYVLYVVFKELGLSQVWSTIGSLFILLEDQFWGHIIPLIRVILSGTTDHFLSYLDGIMSPPFYSRLENPQFSGIFFFIALWAAYRMMLAKITVKTLFCFWVSSIVLIYSYPFYAIYIALLAIVFTMITFIKDPQKTKQLILLGLACAAFALPYFLQLYWFYQLPQHGQLSIRWGQERQIPYIPPIAIITLLALGIFYWKSYAQKKPILLMIISIICAIVAMFIFPVQTNHFVSRILVPVLRIAWIFGFVIVLDFLVKKYRQIEIKKYTASFCLLFILTNSLIHSVVYTQHAISSFTLSPDRLAAYQWITSHVPAESVVASLSVETNFQLSAFAPVYPFTPYAMFSFAPDTELENRLLLMYKATQATDETITATLSQTKLATGRWLPNADELEQNGGFIYFTDRVQKSVGYGFNTVEMNHFLKEFHNFPDVNFKQIARQYRLNYVFWGPFEKTHFSPPERLKKVFENSEISVYKVDAT
jgi:hypothetical protein